MNSQRIRQERYSDQSVNHFPLSNMDASIPHIRNVNANRPYHLNTNGSIPSQSLYLKEKPIEEYLVQRYLQTNNYKSPYVKNQNIRQNLGMNVARHELLNCDFESKDSNRANQFVDRLYQTIKTTSKKEKRIVLSNFARDLLEINNLIEYSNELNHSLFSKLNNHQKHQLFKIMSFEFKRINPNLNWKKIEKIQLNLLKNHKPNEFGIIKYKGKRNTYYFYNYQFIGKCKLDNRNILKQGQTGTKRILSDKKSKFTLLSDIHSHLNSFDIKNKYILDRNHFVTDILQHYPSICSNAQVGVSSYLAKTNNGSTIIDKKVYPKIRIHQFKQAIKDLDALTHKGVMLIDLKPENLMISKENEINFIDTEHWFHPHYHEYMLRPTQPTLFSRPINLNITHTYQYLNEKMLNHINSFFSNSVDQTIYNKGTLYTSNH